MSTTGQLPEPIHWTDWHQLRALQSSWFYTATSLAGAYGILSGRTKRRLANAQRCFSVDQTVQVFPFPERIPWHTHALYAIPAQRLPRHATRTSAGRYSSRHDCVRNGLNQTTGCARGSVPFQSREQLSFHNVFAYGFWCDLPRDHSGMVRLDGRAEQFNVKPDCACDSAWTHDDVSSRWRLW